MIRGRASDTTRRRSKGVNKRAELESRLKELNDSIVVNQIEAGRVLAELRETFEHGQWMPIITD